MHPLCSPKKKADFSQGEEPDKDRQQTALRRYQLGPKDQESAHHEVATEQGRP